MANPPLRLSTNTIRTAGAVESIPSSGELYLTDDNIVFNATTSVLQGFTEGSGTYLNTYTKDGVPHQLDEAAGTANQWVRYDFFVSDLAPPALIKLKAYYEGTHDVILEIYNYDASAWNALTGETTDLPNSSVYSNYTFAIDESALAGNLEDYVSGTGASSVRISHVANGLAAHNLYVDRIAIYKSTLELPTALTPVTVTGMMAGDSSDITQSAADGKFTITRAGQYLVTCSMSFESLDNDDVEAHIFKNGVIQDNTGMARGFGSEIHPGSASLQGKLDLNIGDYVEVKFLSERDSSWVSIQHMNFAINRLN